ncbi:MAG: hypothetical protein OXI59_03125, partial [Gemmatimonadota bacterium]|nr:hypothetical protein [Gemmatimonadota bacterium]
MSDSALFRERWKCSLNVLKVSSRDVPKAGRLLITSYANKIGCQIPLKIVEARGIDTAVWRNSPKMLIQP